VPPPAKGTPNKRSLSPSEIGVKETGVECQFRVKGKLAVRERGTSASHRLLALGFAACFIVPAHAVHWDWDIGYRRPGFVHHHYRDHLSDIERQRVRLYQEAEIDAGHRAEHREGRRDECGCDDDRGFHCLEPIRGVGTEWIGKEGALKGARKDWMERVRYDHGERFIDMTNDRDEGRLRRRILRPCCFLDERVWVRDPFVQGRLIPSDTRSFDRLGICEVRNRPSLTPHHTVEIWPKSVVVLHE